MYLQLKMNQDKAYIGYKMWKKSKKGEKKIFLVESKRQISSVSKSTNSGAAWCLVVKELKQWRLILNLHWFRYPCTSFAESFSRHYWKRREQYLEHVFWQMMLKKFQILMMALENWLRFVFFHPLFFSWSNIVLNTNWLIDM